MLWSPKRSLSNIHVKLTATGLLRKLQLLSGYRRSTMVFHTVDRGKLRASSCNKDPQNSSPCDLVNRESNQHKDQSQDVGHRREDQLIASDRRFLAAAVIIQHIFTKHEDVVKRRTELSQELATLRGELGSLTATCDRLQQEKEELNAVFQGALQKVQEKHQQELANFEEQQQAFYSAEWEKVHEAYQEQADRCRSQMLQEVDDLKSKHDAFIRQLETSHSEKMECLRLQCETSFEELRKKHEQEILALDETLKEAEGALSNQIEELKVENSTLKAEEGRRKASTEKTRKDPHTIYLEQELDSLKVVLDIKIQQLHQQDQKLMQMEKLVEKNVQLEECLKKVQQENEDFKARMDKHAALSRQLSTEQAVLQESLQKESKVNKRLSMENEELLWKLHNGDLGSPRKVSPSSVPVSFQSPRSSAILSSSPSSPR
uniref:Microtubule associated tumor suppressor 1a n=1 Tax=Paramormyrops kingsleyae TaxID=1676925 RepID=A0A3B3RV91_9TELE|nr:microtubule-associated tumor suppressor 1 homolog A-like isoform X1 [Paramormyrops kingsleyae]XP_023670494.1 microtubule-associated tumor suppressor 1 homolog A-like isoform X1 [Paramormyrops kingsleyae]